jgi:Uma2 family endonuclease
MSTQLKMTAQEYFDLPETTQITELLDGELFVTPTPIDEHQAVVTGLAAFLISVRKEKGGTVRFAPLSVYFTETDVPEPDAFWIAPDGQCKLDAEGKWWVGAPDFIAEVASPGTAQRDRDYKFRLYEQHGVREYWMLDPRDKLIEVWARVEGIFKRIGVFGAADTFPSPLFGAVQVAALFAF